MGGQTAKQSLTPPFPYGWAAGAKGRYIQCFRNKILNLKGSQGEALPSTLLGTAGPFLKRLHRRCPRYNVLELLSPKNKKD
ncbi:MAG: hypothetical protein PWQ66_133 [Petrotoga sp.]|nr:hypothetical protein [Petrotoga sp.]